MTHEISQISNSTHFSPICDFQNALIDFKLEVNVFHLQDLSLSCSIVCILVQLIWTKHGILINLIIITYKL